MKKSLIALAVLAASGAAMAQSSVTLFGIVDAGIARLSGSNGHNIGMTNSGLNSSRLGFRGTEDLGGGLSAGFHLEGAVFNDTGTGASTTTPTTVGGVPVPAIASNGFDFQRRSTVSLNGAFGEVRLGRDYAPSFWNTTVFDPFGTVGVGAGLMPAMLGAPVRNNNSVGYFLPGNLGGFYGQAQYAFGENPSNAVPATDAGDYAGFRVGYANGPVNAAFGYGKLDTGAGATKGDNKATNLGVSYNFGVVTPMFSWAQEKARVGAVTTKQNAWEIGATAPIGAGELRAAYSRYDLKGSPNDFRKVAIGYGHNLSKRTQLYTTYGRVTNKGASNRLVVSGGLSAAGLNTPGRNTSGFEFGVRHSF
ncbi:MAG: porin [Burkholderiaceae bacterium]